jgi:hypothetical protein
MTGGARAAALGIAGAAAAAVVSMDTAGGIGVGAVALETAVAAAADVSMATPGKAGIASVWVEAAGKLGVFAAVLAAGGPGRPRAVPEDGHGAKGSSWPGAVPVEMTGCIALLRLPEILDARVGTRSCQRSSSWRGRVSNS